MFKYIIFEDKRELTSVVIFDCITDHSRIARKFDLLKVVSAGKLNKDFICSNGSVTLGLKFNLKQSEEDTQTIKKLSELY